MRDDHASRKNPLGDLASCDTNPQQAFIFVLVYAIGDEFHQSFIPSRTASFGDVMINMFGGVCGISLTWARGILATLPLRTKRQLEVASDPPKVGRQASHRFPPLPQSIEIHRVL
jgi:hypothetical protein